MVMSENQFTVPILGVTPKESLILRKITGLNPPDLTLFIGDYSRDGGTYQGRRVGNRNVVMTFDLNPNPALGETIASLRQMLYKAFNDPQPDADYIQVHLHDDDGSMVYFVGYTETFNGEVFDADTSVQISILCPDPYLRDSDPTVLVNSSGWVRVPFTYQGTAETGFEVEVHLTGPTTTLALANNSKAMILQTALANTDVVYYNTIRGSRKIWKATATDVAAGWAANPTWEIGQIWQQLFDDGLTTSLLAYFTGTWLELHSQANTLNTHGHLITDLMANIQNVTFTAAYWGI